MDGYAVEPRMTECVKRRARIMPLRINRQLIMRWLANHTVIDLRVGAAAIVPALAMQMRAIGVGDDQAGARKNLGTEDPA